MSRDPAPRRPVFRRATRENPPPLFPETPPQISTSAPASRHAREWQPPFALVAFDRTQSALGRELTYAIPDELRETVVPGMAVVVPFGAQQITGYVIELLDKCVDCEPSKLRPITQTTGSAPVFDRTALRLARWMSAYYHCALGECLGGMVPKGWQVASERKYFVCAPDALRALRDLSRSPRQAQIVQLLLDSDTPLAQKEILKHLQKHEQARGADSTLKLPAIANALRALVKAEIVDSEDQLSNPSVRPRRVLAVQVLAQGAASTCDEETQKLARNAPRQDAALRQLRELSNAEGAPEWFPLAMLQKEWKIDSALWRALEKKNLVRIDAIEQTRASYTRLPPSDRGRIELNAEQTLAVQEIGAAMTRVSDKNQEKSSELILLQGVTASGKTEVYLHAIEKCLALGRRALVLVPEIALTAQTVEIFQRRFQEKVAILHSALGAGERFDEWRRIRSGEADIVVGARSAVFAPCQNVGLIIIDEEHDGSYKQDATPRYHARDVAAKRASWERGVVVLGSATPSLESFQRATKGEYGHLQLRQRFAERPLPTIEIVDMTEEAQGGSLPVLSQRLQDALVETLARGEQAIIFLNRRGFATYVQCLGCGHVEQCPNCDVSLTFHRGAQLLRCHHCDYEKPVVHECPQCAGAMMSFSGSGTEKVQNEVESLLSQRGLERVQVLRMDRDTTSGKGAHAQILQQFRQGRAQVLIGTQMVTKGLDFPNVTLVGVISADTALNVPDFRAAERTFQLLSQVAGRAGRGERPGRVLVQTLSLDHYAITTAQNHDYASFVEQELAQRRELPYPPWSYVVNVLSQDENEQVARERLSRLAARFQAKIMQAGGATELLGPVSCPDCARQKQVSFSLAIARPQPSALASRLSGV